MSKEVRAVSADEAVGMMQGATASDAQDLCGMRVTRIVSNGEEIVLVQGLTDEFLMIK